MKKEKEVMEITLDEVFIAMDLRLTEPFVDEEFKKREEESKKSLMEYIKDRS